MLIALSCWGVPSWWGHTSWVESVLEFCPHCLIPGVSSFHTACDITLIIVLSPWSLLDIKISSGLNLALSQAQTMTNFKSVCNQIPTFALVFVILYRLVCPFLVFLKILSVLFIPPTSTHTHTFLATKLQSIPRATNFLSTVVLWHTCRTLSGTDLQLA